jgi:transposase
MALRVRQLDVMVAAGIQGGMTELPDLSQLTHKEKDALIRALWAQVQVLTAQVQMLPARVAELEAKLGVPPKTPGNSSLPLSRGKKPNRPEKAKRHGPRPGSLGWIGGGRALAATPDGTVIAKPVRCAHWVWFKTGSQVRLGWRCEEG